jgi:polyisoprenyl-teichoic acid--peptidoglycan teichoic acid transferase
MNNNIDLLNTTSSHDQNQARSDHQPEQKNQPTKKPIKKLPYIILFLLITFVLFSLSSTVSRPDSDSWLDRLPIIGQLKHLAESADKQLKGEDRDRINILLLGMGGKNHDGGYLTDTIMLVSFEPSTKKVALLSIPRDLSVPVEGMGSLNFGASGWRKINNINAFAEVETPGSGGVAVSQAISDVLNIPVDYYIRFDFDGFINLIDELGGINIYVENTLDDYKYPVLGQETAEPYDSRYEHLHIDQGWQTMDGQLALKFVRSRHALGIEGSDFARAKRQQKIIEAVKDQVLSLHVLFKPKLISGIIETLHEHVSTNLKVWEMVKLWDLAKGVDSQNIVSKVLDNSPNGLLTDLITAEGAYVLIPRSGDFSEIQYLVNNIFSDAPLEVKTRIIDEKSAIEILNGTWINGLASKVALDLEKYGFNITHVGNSSRQNFAKSVIYDLTYGAKMQSLTILKNKTGANISFGLPQWLIDELSVRLADQPKPIQPDFILILGQDADSTASGIENTIE